MDVETALLVAIPFSKCPRVRLEAMANELIKLDRLGIEGDVVECGVWRGGGAILARLISPQRTVWLFDTFTGMANPSEYDRTRKGYVIPEGKTAAPLSEVLANLTITGVMDDSLCRIVEGKVEDTLIKPANVPDKIALLHLDTDWYHSTKKELEVLWPRVQKRGVLIVDDYGHWLGARRAVDEYFAPAWNHHKTNIDYTAVVMIKK